jgi:hypothetical protein
VSADGWIARAEAALAAGRGGEQVDVFVARRPPMADLDGVRALSAPVLAAAVWLLAVFREQTTETPLDPVALLIRLLALGLTVRAVLLGAMLVKRARTWLQTRRYGLALTPEGMLFRTPRGDVAAAREDMVDVRERGDWRQRSAARRWSEVYVLIRPSASPTGDPYVSIPPLFERSPGILAERLMRWRGPVQGPEHPEHPEPNRLASKVYERAAVGQVPRGGLVVPHGRGWLRRGPYATVLLSIAILDGLLRLPSAAWSAIPPVYPLGLAACLAVVPVVWIGLTRRHVAPRKGLALVMTPAEVMMRTREGILRAQWRNLGRVTIEQKGTWSILEGYHQARKLVLERNRATTIRYDEAFLGMPAEVVQGLCEGYKKGTLP